MLKWSRHIQLSKLIGYLELLICSKNEKKAPHILLLNLLITNKHRYNKQYRVFRFNIQSKTIHSPPHCTDGGYVSVFFSVLSIIDIIFMNIPFLGCISSILSIILPFALELIGLLSEFPGSLIFFDLLPLYCQIFS